MIRLFTALCKTMLESLTDGAIFQESTDGFKHHGEKCPSCGATGKLAEYGKYNRSLVSIHKKKVGESRVSPLRFSCASCGSTHALLPDIITPYSPYSLRFKLCALIAYFKRDTTVEGVCKQFGIAVSTIYAWKGLLLSHKELMLGVLASRKESAHAFLIGLLSSADLSARLRGFHSKHAHSFLQGRSKVAAQTRPP